MSEYENFNIRWLSVFLHKPDLSLVEKHNRYVLHHRIEMFDFGVFF